MDTIPIGGIWLHYVGGENDSNARVSVEVEVDGKWIEVISEAHQSPFSHCVTAEGIETARRGSAEREE